MTAISSNTPALWPRLRQCATANASPLSSSTWNRLPGSHSELSTLGRSQVQGLLRPSSTGQRVLLGVVIGTSVPLSQTKSRTVTPIAMSHLAAYSWTVSVSALRATAGAARQIAQTSNRLEMVTVQPSLLHYAARFYRRRKPTLCPCSETEQHHAGWLTMQPARQRVVVGETSTTRRMLNNNTSPCSTWSSQAQGRGILHPGQDRRRDRAHRRR
jgi:hypothetical protein